MRSEAVPDSGPLLRNVDPHHPLAFVRGGDGIVGIGEAVRSRSAGPDRIREAADAWRTICASATVEDAVRVPRQRVDCGMGSFAFADDSAASALIVPAVVAWAAAVVLRGATVIGVIAARHASRAVVARSRGSPEFRKRVTESRLLGHAGRAKPTTNPAVAFGPGAFPAHAYALAVAAAVERIRAGELEGRARPRPGRRPR